MKERSRRSGRYEAIGTAHIATLLAEAIRDPRRVREALGVWPAWEEAVGPQVAAAARPVSLREGILTVHVKNTVWLQELHMQRATLLRRVRRVPAGSAVKGLRFRVGAIPAASEQSVEKKQKVATGPIPYEMARTIKTVESPALRGALIRVAARWSGLERMRKRDEG